MDEKKAIRVALVVIVSVLFFVGFHQCTDEYDGVADAGDPSLGYTEFKVDGMPCLLIGEMVGSSSKSLMHYGVTCDWSKKKQRN